jgi:hypothetical protein
MRRKDAKEEPEQVRDDDILAVIADARFNQLHFVRAERHRRAPPESDLRYGVDGRRNKTAACRANMEQQIGCASDCAALV